MARNAHIMGSSAYGKKIKGDVVMTFIKRASKSPFVLFVWTLISSSAFWAIMRKHSTSYFKYFGFILPLLVICTKWKSIKWDVLLMKTSFDVLVGTREKVSKVDDNLYLGVTPLSEEGDAMLLGKKLGINAVVSVLEPFQQVGSSLVGTPLSKDEWRHIGIESHDRLVLDKCKDGDPFTLTLMDLHKVSDFLDRHLSNNRKVLVHCRNGGGHGASLVLAYFLKYKRLGLREAYFDLKRSRGKIDFELQSPQTAALSKLLATTLDGTHARGSGVTHMGVNKRVKGF